MNRFTFDTKKPLGNPNGIRVFVIAIIIMIVFLEFKLLPTTLPKIIHSKERLNVFLYPFLLLIIPVLYPLWKWVNLNVIHHREFLALKKVVQAAQLIDYDNESKLTIFGMRDVVAGVKIFYKKIGNKVEITCYPNGIKNSDRVSQLTDRLEEAFGITVYSVNRELTHTTYLLGDISSNKQEVHENDF